MVGLVVLAFFVVFGLLDSLHFRARLENGDPAGKPRYSVEVTSVLDAVLRQLKERREKTYSAPLAYQLYAARLVRKTRPTDPTTPSWLKPLVAWGAGPRAVQYLILGAKARAALLGSYMVRLEDLEAVAAPVLTHRIITTFAAQAEGIDAKQIVRRLVEETKSAA